jgi:hypothetical protein
MEIGADYEYLLTVRCKSTGNPITDPEIVNALTLVLGTTATTTPVKRYEMNDGITALGAGQFVVTIPHTHTLELPLAGRAYLEGFTLPRRHSIKVDLGNITTNRSNYPTNE